MKKIIILLCVCVASLFNISPYVVYADSTSSNVEKQLESQILKDLGNLDFSDLDDVLNKINNQYNFTNNLSVKNLISQITSGEYFSNYSSIFDVVKNFLFSNLKNVIPLIFLIVGISILSMFLNSTKSSSSKNGVGDLIHFVCFSVVVLVLITTISNVIEVAKTTLSNLSGQMETLLPIMLTLLTATGGLTSVGIYKPIVVVLCNGVSLIFSKFLFPIFVVSFIFLIVGNLSKNIKLNKFNDFLSSVFKWVVGFVCTMFTAFLAIQGISAGKFDGISIKATKFAVKSYIPLIGGFISDGFDLILCSSILIKNAVGVVGIILILFTIISPILQIVVLKLALQLTAAILQPIGDSRICEFCSGCSKILVYPIVLILAVSFMFFVCVGLIMTTANIV